MPTARHSGGWGAENVGDPRIRHVLCELLLGCREELGDTSWRTWAGGRAEPRDRGGGWGERASPWGLGRARCLGTFPGPPRKPSTQQAFNNRTSGNRTHTSSRIDRGPFVLPAESSCPPPPPARLLAHIPPTEPPRNSRAQRRDVEISMFVQKTRFAFQLGAVCLIFFLCFQLIGI